MPDAVIVSGGGHYADPWHPFAETSAALAAVVREAGFTVEINDDPDAALAALGDGVRLVVVNAGDPGDAPASPQAAAAASALDRALDRGIGVLAMHAAAASLRAYPAYERLLGGRWVREVSWHPPFGEARVHVVGDHAVADGLADFTVLDERYTGLRVFGEIEPIAEHEEGGARHPLVWAREVGRSRIVYDALGHDARSFDSSAHRALITSALRWLAAVDAR